MNLENLVQPAAWMTQEERHTAASLVAAFQQNFTVRSLPENPFLTLRMRYLLLHLTLCRRLEQTVFGDSKEELTPAAAAHIGKALERFRKALKDLEDTANRLDPAKHNPLPSFAGKKAPTPAPRPEPEKMPAAPKSPQSPGPVVPLPDPTRKVQSQTIPPSPLSAASTLPTGPTGPTSPAFPTISPPKSPQLADRLRTALQPAQHVSRTVPQGRR